MLGRASRFYFSENVNVNFHGEENVSNISLSKDINLNSNRSDLLLRDCESVEASIEDSRLTASRSKRIKLRGQENNLRGEDNVGILFSGNKNTANLDKIHELTWSGSRSECKLDTEEQPKVYGNDNQILAKLNANLLVVGNKNNIQAERNANLRIRGCSNNVHATQTRNLTIDGCNNNCSVSGTTFGHSLIRIPEKSSIENVIQFHAKIVPRMVCEGARLVPPEEGRFASYYFSKRVLNLSTNRQQFEERVQYTSLGKQVLSEVKILYVGVARIVGKSYRLGLFDLHVDGLTLWEGTPSVKVKILGSPVEGLDCRVEQCTTGKSATATAFSNGSVVQRLKIVANKVSVNPEDVMEIDVKFEPTEEEL